MTIKEVIEGLRQEWQRSVGNYRYQNPQKVVKEDILYKAISILERMDAPSTYVMYSSSGRQLCPICDCTLVRWYSFCPDCGARLDWNTDRDETSNCPEISAAELNSILNGG